MFHLHKRHKKNTICCSEKEQLPLLKVMEGRSFTSTRGGVLCLKNKGIGWRNPSSEYGMEVELFSKHYKIKDGGFSIKR
jgi:hypothetical protein